MSKIEWGTKRLCAKCDAPFYDMQRFPIRCPKCDAVFRVDAPRIRSAAAKRTAKARSERSLPKTAAAGVGAEASDGEGRKDRAGEVELLEKEDDDEEERGLDDPDDDDEDDADDDGDDVEDDKADKVAHDR